MSDLLKNKREKLARTRADERHLFLGTSYTTDWADFLPLSTDQLAAPDVDPSLLSEITHLWIMNFQTPGRCLVWYPELGWRDTRLHWRPIEGECQLTERGLNSDRSKPTSVLLFRMRDVLNALRPSLDCSSIDPRVSI